MIQIPPSPSAFADRELDCQVALADEFMKLAQRAEAVGWKGSEVAGALLALSMAHIKARIGAANEAIGRRKRRRTLKPVCGLPIRERSCGWLVRSRRDNAAAFSPLILLFF